mgnify:CR=1 FL=1
MINIRRHNILFYIGILIIIIFLTLSIFGQYIVPYGYDDQDLMVALTPPSMDYYFGTDEIGRDIYSRVILGTKYTLFVALISVIYNLSINLKPALCFL